MRRLDHEGRFLEGARWRNGRWWVSDMVERAVCCLDMGGRTIDRITFEDRPSGLGWLPDGALIAVGMDSRTLMRVGPGSATATRHIDLTAQCGDLDGYINDMAVTPDGHIYVGFDPDFHRYGFDCPAGAIIHVDPAGRADVVATGLHFPNGMVVTADGATLIVAETGSPRLTAFARASDGGLHDRRIWAAIGPDADHRHDRRRPLPLDGIGLDGCAIDRRGHVWVANAHSSSCLRVAPDGGIVDGVAIPDGYRCLACAIGGEEGELLLLCGLALSPDDDLATSRSHLFVVEHGAA
ncbi:SMP-30/gluconolactonase/LRE family protein [Sphingomonas solaris]|uniref:SMP-30/gluconolactonase/LRE family protein n=1 Tax=Alterirhizorhabdus solaris TaxID=2529389 RepID=A0A558R8X3_9SPHN|nr:SMP-30/gluconolactonase/LRE family protein [Sphingomonas solaris]TVV75843.1 SMP-30/gluconolactonase/LRE family protein [Sphingomonas solaris]